MRRSRIWFSLLGLLGAAGIALGLNMLAEARLGARQIDLTAGHLYTLSPGTRTVLRDLRQPVTLSLYYSPALGLRAPAYGVYAAHVRQMLRRYAALSHGRVTVRFFDPRPFSRVEDRAIADGLSGVPIDQAGTRVYFGLVATNLLDQRKTIPFLDPAREPFLEYDLTLLIDQVSGHHRPVVGVMSSLPLAGDFRALMMAHGQGNVGRPWLIWRELSRNFATRLIPATVQEIPRAVRVLLLVQPQNLSLATKYAIDQFVMRGGRLMLLVDPRSEAQVRIRGPNGQPAAVTGSNLTPLLADWGVSYDPAKVLAQVSGALRVASPNPADPMAGVPYIPWFTIRKGIDRADPALAGIGQVTVASSGFLAPKKGAAIRFTPLLSSSPQSEVLPLSAVSAAPDPARLLARFTPSGKPRVIAARIHGILHSAFPGPVSPPKGQTRPAHFPPYIAQTAKPADLVVLADSDVLDNAVLRLPQSENAAFVLNLVGSLAGGDPLLSLRARGVVSRPFSVVARMRRTAEEKFRRTELALQSHLKATEAKLAALRTGNPKAGADAALLTPAQAAAIAGLRRDVIATHRRLRRVQYDLNRRIARLEMLVRLADIVAVPAALTLIALLIALLRRTRRNAARRNRPARA